MTKEEAALFSYLAYTPALANSVNSPTGWVPVADFDRTFTGTFGFGARVFFNASTGESAVTFRGTDFTSPADWITNLELAAGHQRCNRKLGAMDSRHGARAQGDNYEA